MTSQLPNLTPAEWRRVAAHMRAKVWAPLWASREVAAAACEHLAQTPVMSEPGEDEREHCRQVVALVYDDAKYAGTPYESSTYEQFAEMSAKRIADERAQVRAEYERKLDDLTRVASDGAAQAARELDDLTKAAAEREQAAREEAERKGFNAGFDARSTDFETARTAYLEYLTKHDAERQRADRLAAELATLRDEYKDYQTGSAYLTAGQGGQRARERFMELRAERDDLRRLLTEGERARAELKAQHQALREAAESLDSEAEQARDILRESEPGSDEYTLSWGIEGALDNLRAILAKDPT